MKKLFLVALLVVLALPVMAWSANPLTSGQYKGTITSVVPDLNGKTVNAEVTNTNGNTVATVTYADGTKEVWNWNATQLNQQEFDKANKPALQYTAKATTPGKYEINCTDKVKNVCDGNIDWRNYWTINNTTNGFTYTTFGVNGTENKTNPTAPVVQRHQFNFTLVK